MARVTYMNYMFYDAIGFNQNLCLWGNMLQSTDQVPYMFTGSGCPYTGNPDMTINPKSPLCSFCPRPFTSNTQLRDAISSGQYNLVNSVYG